MEAPNRTAVLRAIEILGSQRALARALEISSAAIGQWGRQGQDGGRGVPPRQCVRIERLTSGAVTRRDLRPDDWQDIWPELANPQENTPPAPAVRAQAAINSDVCEVAHG